jgi:hypothetical protein
MITAFLHRFISLQLGLGALSFCLSIQSFGQTPPTDPSPPIAPRDYKECSNLELEYEALLDLVDKMHEDCLDSRKKSGEKPNPGFDGGFGPICTFGSCQSLHNRKNEVKANQTQEVNACRMKVKQFQEQEQRRKDEKERLLREEQARRQKAEDERLRQVRERENAQAAKRRAEEENDSRRTEAEKNRKREEADQKLLVLAAKESQQRQQKLREDTEERRKAMEELKQRRSAAEARFNEAVQEQTQKAQDDLSRQIAANSGREDSIFPLPTDPNPGVADFDTNSIENRAEWLTPEKVEQMRALWTLPEGPWRNTINQLSDGARRLREFAKDQVKYYLDQVPNKIIREINPDGNVVRLDPLSKGISAFVHDAMKTRNEPNQSPTLGSWVKDQSVETFGKWGSQEIRERLDKVGQITDPNDPVKNSFHELWRAARPDNLDRGIKPYLDRLVEKWSAFWGLASDSFIDNPDRKDK